VLLRGVLDPGKVMVGGTAVTAVTAELIVDVVLIYALATVREQVVAAS